MATAAARVRASEAEAPRAGRLRPTLLGWLVLAEGAVLVSTLAWPAQSRPLGAVLGLGLIAAIGVSLLAAPRRLRALRAEWLPPEAPVAGEECLLGARLSADGGSGPFTVEAHDPQKLARTAVGTVPGLEAAPARLTWTARFPRRGVHWLPPLLAASEQPFGLIVAGREISTGLDVVVLPPVGLLKRDLRDRLDRWLEALVIGNEPGDDELSHLRGYRPGDPPHRVHWRASARARRLLVAERVAPAARRIAIVLDTDRQLVTPRRLDRLASIAATFIDHLLRRGWEVSLHGRFAQSGVAGDRQRLFETLALVEAGPSEPPLGECIPEGRPCLVLAGRPVELGPLRSRPLVLTLDECEELVRLPKRARL